jgi:hypothetical protein
VVASFDQAATIGTIKHFGLTRVLRLEDSATGAEMNLQVVGRIFAQSGPDPAVLAALVPTA